MKKLLSMTLALTLITATLLPRRADAGVGAIALTGGAAAGAIVAATVFGGVGLGFAGIGGLISLFGLMDPDSDIRNGEYSNYLPVTQFMVTAGASLLFVGLVILDEKDPEALKYSKISDELATKLGINKNEQFSFNKKIASINQIGKSISKKCTVDFLKEKKVKSEESIGESDLTAITACADKRWEEFKKSNPQVLTSGVYQTIQTIRNQSI